jgi:hypothetical protein
VPETSTALVKDLCQRWGAEFAKRPDMPSTGAWSDETLLDESRLFADRARGGWPTRARPKLGP